MEPSEIRLYDLLESTDFDNLSEDERLFVLSQMTEQEYRQQRYILVSASELDFPQAVPLPLLIPAKGQGFLTRSIPLYQVFMGAAASLLFVFFLWPKEKTNSEIIYVQGKTIVDTVFQTKTLFDTLFIEDTKTKRIAQNKTPDTVYILKQNYSSSHLPPRKLEAPNAVSLPDLNPNQLKNKGRSMKEDDVTNLLPETRNFGL